MYYFEKDGVLKEKHLSLTCSHYNRHVEASHRFKFEFTDMSASQSFNN